MTWIEQGTGEGTGRKMAEQVVAVLNGKPLGRIHHLAKPRLVAGETDGPLPATMPTTAEPAKKARPRVRKPAVDSLS